MKKLADISTFNRVCKIANTTADDNRIERLKFYDMLPVLSYKYFTHPKQASTIVGKTLMGQQMGYTAYLNKGTYKDYYNQLNIYNMWSKEFKNLFANKYLDKQTTPDLIRLRHRIEEFDSSIKNFLCDLQNNLVYRKGLE